MATGFDSLSELPDNILSCNIFSLLPLKDVIRTSILSRRWRYLWIQIPNLKFLGREFFPEQLISMEEPSTASKYISDGIYNVLALHSGALQSFHYEFDSPYADDYFEDEVSKSLNIEQWIHIVALKNVKQIYIDNYGGEQEIPPSIFACKQLTDLTICYFDFARIPSNFEGFLFLRRLSLWGLEITAENIQRLVTLCPILETLKVQHCCDVITLKIEALNLKYLKLILPSIESLAADCPQLVKLKLGECSRLSKLQLNSLRKLSLKNCLSVAYRASVGLLGRFPLLEELEMREYFLQDIIAVVRMVHEERAARNMVADFAFPNLKIAHVEILFDLIEAEEMRLVSFLLKNAPSLNIMFLTLPFCTIHNRKEFLEEFLDLDETISKANIKIVAKKNLSCLRCEVISECESDEPLSGER